MSFDNLHRSVRYYDSIAHQYDEYMNAAPGTLWVRSAFQQLVATTVPVGSLLLDFGCGTGSDAISLASRGRRVIAYDHSPGMIARLRSKADNHVAAGEILPVEGSFTTLLAELANQPKLDAIISNFAVLNLLKEPSIMFTGLAPYVCPHGLFIVSVLNPIFWKDLTQRQLWRAWARSFGRSAIRVTGPDTELYRHWTHAIRRAATPHFELTKRASVGALIRRWHGPRDWSRPATIAERIEARAWGLFPMTRLGQFFFLVFRRTL